MPTHHDDIALTAGDDWLIAGTLVDEDGAALDLSTVNMIQWVLLGPDGMPALLPNTAIIEIADPPTAGLVNITVPATATKALYPGNYVDAMRVLMTADSRASVWQGIVGVWANPFDAYDTLSGLALLADQSGIGSPEIGVGNMGLSLYIDPATLNPPYLGAPDLE